MKEKGVYKKVYSGEWANGTLREKRVKELLEREGVKVEWHGLGAGREDYIPQSARELGYEIGDPDLKATTRSGREVYIEVSGTSKINENSDIWIRPDKLENVIKTGKDTWFVHVLSASQEIASQEIMMRCIHLTPNLCKDLLADESRKRELKKKGSV